MTMQVLQTKLQIKEARLELIRKGASQLESSFLTFLRKFRIVPSIKLGDMVKSWDVLATLNFLDKNLDKADPVLDIGCYASEILVSLHQIGFTNLTGADLNPALKKMPFPEKIHYEVTNFMHTPFPEASFKAITAVSVIEHGFDGIALLKEMSRLLQPGGYFISSFDYWPEKIDTKGIKIFDMSWRIFSKEEVIEFVKLAESFGFAAEGDMNFDAKTKAIGNGLFEYSFAWLVLKKK